MPERQDKLRRYALALVLMGAVGRILWIVLPHPSSTGPMIGEFYIEEAQAILRLDFHDLGGRVPVYPLFIAMCGVNLRVLWAAQSILGIAASLMIFDMAFRRTCHALFSFLVGLVCSLLPRLLIFERAVMTEALTSFLLVTSFWLISRYGGARDGNVRYPLALGTIVALAGLTRPLMMSLAPVYYCFLVPLWPPTRILRPAGLKRTLAFASPAVLLIMGWCGYNYFKSGYFTPTTWAGQHLMNQVDPYMDLAPDRFAVLRDVWLQSRRKLLPPSDFDSGDVDDVMFEGALPEMKRRTGESNTQVLHEYASLALYMEIHFPLHSLRRAEQSWIRFWGQSEEGDWPKGGKIRLGETLLTMVNFLTREIKATFLILALLSIPCALLSRKAFTRIEHHVFAVALWVSACAGFMEFGEDSRYSIPFYMLIFYTVLTRGWIWITAASGEEPGVTSAP
ncbi:MAG: hypothetical protein ACLQVG_25220 [Terriglobia bacterium]